jgi:hypothetical protein
MTIQQKHEQVFHLAKEKYPESAYAALWGTASVFLTEEQIEKMIQVLEMK